MNWYYLKNIVDKPWADTIRAARALTVGHDPLDCDCEDCATMARLTLDYIATLRLTTDHAASSHGLPVLVDGDGTAYGTADSTPLGAAMPLYHKIEVRDGWRLQWADCGNTLIGVHEAGI